MSEWTYFCWFYPNQDVRCNIFVLIRVLFSSSVNRSTKWWSQVPNQEADLRRIQRFFFLKPVLRYQISKYLAWLWYFTSGLHICFLDCLPEGVCSILWWVAWESRTSISRRWETSESIYNPAPWEKRAAYWSGATSPGEWRTAKAWQTTQAQEERYVDEEAYGDNSKNCHTIGKTTSLTVNDENVCEWCGITIALVWIFFIQPRPETSDTLTYTAIGGLEITSTNPLFGVI
jgi:hypothetical protein